MINKAKEACKNVGQNVADHFPDVRKTIAMPKGADKEIVDYLLTRYACYLVAHTQEHIENNAAVRRILLERGVVPEDLPAEEDVKKVERRLASEEKKAIENKQQK